MARDSRQLYVEIIGDDRQLSRAFKNATNESRKFDRNMSTTFRGVLAGSGAFKSIGRQIAFASGTFLGAAGFTALAKQSVDVASNLAEQANKVGVVFGRSGPSITAWAKTTATSIGIANDQALEAAGTFGNLFRTLGLATDENARLSRSLVKLAADMASFNNADPSEVLLALRSGLIGEAEPLRRFGVLLTEARVQQEAMRETGKRNARDLTAQEKVLARYALIIKDTASAQGDFARTQDGLANSQRQLSAELRDTEAVIGKALLPTVKDVTQALRDWLAKPSNQQKIQEDTQKTVGFFGQLFHVAKDVGGGFKDVADAINQVHLQSMRLNRALENGVQNIYKETDALKSMNGEAARFRGFAPALAREVTGEDVALRGAAARTGTSVTGAGGGGGRAAARRLSFQGQMNRLEMQLARALTTIGVIDDRALLVQERHLLNRWIANTKDWQKRRQLYQDLARVDDQISGIDEDRRRAEEDARNKKLAADKEAAAKAKEAADKAKAHAAKLKEAAERTRRAYQDMANTVRDAFGGLFQGPVLNPSDDVRKRTLGVPATGAKQLVADYRAQTRAFVKFNNDLARLARRGAPAGLVSQLRGMGLEGAGYVHTLATARGGTLRQLFRSFTEREKVVQRIAHAEVHARTVTVNVQGMRVGTSTTHQRRGRNAGVLAAADRAGGGSPWVHG